MKSTFYKLGYVFVFLFICGLILSAYYLYNFPEELSRRASLDLNNLKEMQPLFTELNIVISLVLFTGLIAIMIVIINHRSNESENLVYVKSFKDKKQENQQNAEVHIQDQVDLSTYDEILNSSGELKKIVNKVLWTACKSLEASQAAFYLSKIESENRYIELFASFAYSVPDSQNVRYEYGEGLAGQVAKEGRMINIKAVPEGYIKVLSGLGSSSPTNLILVPVKENNHMIGVVEIASFKEFSATEEDFLQQLFSKVAAKFELPVDGGEVETEIEDNK